MRHTNTFLPLTQALSTLIRFFDMPRERKNRVYNTGEMAESEPLLTHPERSAVEQNRQSQPSSRPGVRWFHISFL